MKSAPAVSGTELVQTYVSCSSVQDNALNRKLHEQASRHSQERQHPASYMQFYLSTSNAIYGIKRVFTSSD